MGMLATCNCDEMKKLLREFGAKNLVAGPDLKPHFRDEENHVIPLMRVYGLGAEADRIVREHRALEGAKLGATRDRLLSMHAAFEDRCVVELKRRIALEKGAFAK